MIPLFQPLQLRELIVPNRLWMSPMGTCSAETHAGSAGLATDFHVVHYGARALGGVGLVIVEATAVSAIGRTSPWDLGLWHDSQIAPLARVADAIRSGGAIPAIQLHHAGRKASVGPPWAGEEPLSPEEDGWVAVGPSCRPRPGYPAPRVLDRDEIAGIVGAFRDAAVRACKAGFEVVEIHAAHGYLLHSFLSPIANDRTDDYGGTLENRTRLVLEVVDAVRSVWPAARPLFIRISGTDWIAENPEDARGAWTIEDSVVLARMVHQRGVDLIDVSSGGIEPVHIPRDPDYQTALAARIRRETGIPIAAVGRINTPHLAAELVEKGAADATLIGKELLRDLSWANNAASVLGTHPRFIGKYEYFLKRPVTGAIAPSR